MIVSFEESTLARLEDVKHGEWYILNKDAERPDLGENHIHYIKEMVGYNPEIGYSIYHSAKVLYHDGEPSAKDYALSLQWDYAHKFDTMVYVLDKNECMKNL